MFCKVILCGIRLDKYFGLERNHSWCMSTCFFINIHLRQLLTRKIYMYDNICVANSFYSTNKSYYTYTIWICKTQICMYVPYMQIHIDLDQFLGLRLHEPWSRDTFSCLWILRLCGFLVNGDDQNIEELLWHDM